MATNTYVALDKVTVTTATPSITFTGISQAYTDLIVVASSTNARSLFYRVGNSSVDSGSNYSRTQLIGDGSSATSGRASNENKAYMSLTTGSGTVYQTITQFNNYSNTTTYKTFLTRYNDASVYTAAIVSLWRSTAAINIITITGDGGDIPAGSTFSLYGIAAASVGAKATGGTIYSDDQYYYHVFGSTGTFTPLQSLSADVLVVAGGGGGGRIVAGGGGAGGLLAFTSQSLTATGYTCTVGAGGAGSTTSGYSAGTVGGDSQFGGLTLVKGGGAGGAINGGGGTGGSGGGAGGSNIAQTGGAATSGQGNVGADRSSSSNYEGSGGGGAGGAGTSNTATNAGSGGVGVSTYSSWLSATGFGENVAGTYYIAGGGGGGWSSAGATIANIGAGGYGGGGRGGYSNQSTTVDVAPVAGTANTGGGGGGAPNDLTGNNTNTYGASGGSGLVIVRYAK